MSTSSFSPAPLRAAFSSVAVLVFAALASAPVGCGGSVSEDGGAGGAPAGGAAPNGGAAPSGGASPSGGAAPTGGSGGGVTYACPRDLPDDPHFCQIGVTCGDYDVPECPGDPSCPTEDKNPSCTGTCTDGKVAHASCDNHGDWTCDDGVDVTHCTSNDCLHTCCFVACKGPHDHGKVQLHGGTGTCSGQARCGGKEADTECDANGDCTCTYDGKMLGTCKNQGAQRDNYKYCSRDVGCCSAFLLGCE